MVRQTGVSRATVDRLYHAVQTKDELLQEKLLNPSMNWAGWKPVISTDESVMIRDRIKYAAKHWFAMSVKDMKNVMYEIAFDGQKTFRTDTALPSADDIRYCRAVNRYITYRNVKRKDAAKLQAEIYDHIAGFAKVLWDVGNGFPRIFRTLLDCGTVMRRRFNVNKMVFGAVDSGIIPLRPGLGERRMLRRGSTRRGGIARIDPIRRAREKGEAHWPVTRSRPVLQKRERSVTG